MSLIYFAQFITKLAVMATDLINEGSEPMVSDMESEESKEQIRLAEEKKDAANILYSAKLYKQALAGYNEVIELCPNISKYYGNRAACYMMLRQYRDAMSDAKKCIQLNPQYFKGYARVIKCCLILGDVVEAENTLTKLLELDPFNKSITAEKRDLAYVQKHLKIADTAYSAKDYRKVVFCMDRCCDVSISCIKFKLTKAECLVFLERFQEAQEIANDVLHTDKQNVDAIYIRGMCLYFQDNIDRAFAHFQQVLRLAPDHPKALQIYKRAKNLKQKKEDGNTAYKMEQYQKAYKLYTEALSIDPQNTVTNAKLHFNKATVAAKLGRLNESITECTEALKLDEKYLKALLRRAVCYMDLKQFEDAVHDLEKAYKIEKSRENKQLLMEAKLELQKSLRKDYYKILGIDKNASTDEIKKAYRKRALVYHPDRHANASEGEKKEQEKKFKEVGEAYGILSDPKKRSRYDSGNDTDDGDAAHHGVDPHAMFKMFFEQPGGYRSQSSGFCTSDFVFNFE